MQATKGGGHGDLEVALGLLAATCHKFLTLLQFGEDTHTALVVLRPLFCQAELARGTIEQAHPKLFLQTLQPLARHREREAKLTPRRAETSCLYRLGKHHQVGDVLYQHILNKSEILH